MFTKAIFLKCIYFFHVCFALTCQFWVESQRQKKLQLSLQDEQETIHTLGSGAPRLGLDEPESASHCEHWGATFVFTELTSEVKGKTFKYQPITAQHDEPRWKGFVKQSDGGDAFSPS